MIEITASGLPGFPLRIVRLCAGSEGRVAVRVVVKRVATRRAGRHGERCTGGAILLHQTRLALRRRTISEQGHDNQIIGGTIVSNKTTCASAKNCIGEPLVAFFRTSGTIVTIY